MASGPVVAVDAAEIDDEEADGSGVPSDPEVPVNSEMNVDDDDLIESSRDDAEDETDLYMDSIFDVMLSSSSFVAHDVRSFDVGFLCRGCFAIVDAILSASNPQSYSSKFILLL